MQPSRDEVLARERRWAQPVAIATLVAIGLLVVARIVAGSVSGDGDAEVLREVDEHSADVIASGAMQCVAFLLLVAPLVYLFRAVQARSDRVRGPLIRLVAVAPLFLAVAALLTAVATTEAASEFVAGKVKGDLSAIEASRGCQEERSDDPDAFEEEFGAAQVVQGDGGARPMPPVVACAATKVADDRAEEAIAEPVARDISTGFALGGRFGLAFALFYCCLWAMRTGLLSRFWGSLGMAMGVAALLLLIQFTLVWFLYFALLVAGWVPGGRPPAWGAGEAVPWPTPGEQMAGMDTEEDRERSG